MYIYYEYDNFKVCLRVNVDCQYRVHSKHKQEGKNLNDPAAMHTSVIFFFPSNDCLILIYYLKWPKMIIFGTWSPQQEQEQPQ